MGGRACPPDNAPSHPRLNSAYLDGMTATTAPDRSPLSAHEDTESLALSNGAAGGERHARLALAAAVLGSDELIRLGGGDEIDISTRRIDGSLRPFVPIWIVAVNGALYVRSYRGTGGADQRRG